eukprot:6175134-Pleurochrysis_carterae.AAC.3
MGCWPLQRARLCYRGRDALVRMHVIRRQGYADIDKAPEEKARGITINSVCGAPCCLRVRVLPLSPRQHWATEWAGAAGMLQAPVSRAGRG